jgi:hypothetical protein
VSTANPGPGPERRRSRRLTLTLSGEAWAALADLAFPHRSAFLGQAAAERYFLSELLEGALSAPGRRELGEVLRRSAVRDMVRSGVPQSVAMSISRHRSTSIFLRYDIASDTDRSEALRRTQAHRENVKPTAAVVSISENGHRTGTK